MSRDFSFVALCAFLMVECVAFYCFNERVVASVSCTGYSNTCVTWSLPDSNWTCCAPGGFGVFTFTGEGKKSAISGTGSCGILKTWGGLYNLVPCAASAGGCGGTRNNPDCL